jgi:heat shock protein HtpX
MALASALAKLAQGAARIPNPVADRNPAAAQLYIVPALHGGAGDSLFSTHPATENRIAALQAFAGEMGAVAAAPRVASVPRSASVPSTRRHSSALDPLGRD